MPGRGPQWKKKVIQQDLNGDEEKFAQEYECKFIGLNECSISQKGLEYMERSIAEPIETQMDGLLRIWKKPQNNRVYAIGVDISEGVGKDASVIQVFDFTDLTNIEQVACYANPNIIQIDFEEVIAEVAEMYGNPVLAIERNRSRYWYL